VPGGNRFGAEALRSVDQRRKFQIAVAMHARNRRPSRRVLAHEVGDHVLLELVLEVDDVVRDADRARDAARVVQVIERAAAAELDLTLILVVQLH
jgi:hypothetical protein